MTVCDCNVLNIESWTDMFSLRFQVAKFLGAKTPRRVTSQDAGEAESTLAKDEQLRLFSLHDTVVKPTQRYQF